MWFVLMTAKIAAGILILWLAYQGLIALLDGQWWRAGLFLCATVVSNFVFFGLLFPQQK